MLSLVPVVVVLVVFVLVLVVRPGGKVKYDEVGCGATNFDLHLEGSMRE